MFYCVSDEDEVEWRDESEREMKDLGSKPLFGGCLMMCGDEGDERRMSDGDVCSKTITRALVVILYSDPQTAMYFLPFIKRFRRTRRPPTV